MATPWSVNDLYGVYASGTAMDDAGNRPIMSQAQFDALPEAERFKLASLGGSGGETSIFQDGQNFVGYGDPRFIGQGGFYGGMTTGPDGKFTLSGVDTDKLDAIQRQTDQSGFFNGSPLQNIMKGTGLVLGAGMLNNYFMDGSLFGGAGGAPQSGYMGDPYSLDPGFFDASGNAIGQAGGSGANLGLDAFESGWNATGSAPAQGGNSWWQNALNYAGKNPINAARGVGGLLGAVTSLGGNQSPQGGSGGSQGPQGPAPSFNPVGAAGQFQQTTYKPMQFDPVPFMGDSAMFQNYSPYGGQGYSTLPAATQSQYQNVLSGGGYQGLQGNYGPPGGMNFQSGPSNPSFGKPYQPSQPPMGYAGSGPIPPGMTGNYTSPVQPPPGGWANHGSMGNFGSGSFGTLPGGWGQPSQGVAQVAAQGMGGLLGNMGQPGMSSRDMQMMARYLPGSGTTVDPNASPNALANRFGGNFQNMIPQRLQGKWNQFQQLAGPMNSYEDWRNRYPGM